MEKTMKLYMFVLLLAGFCQISYAQAGSNVMDSGKFQLYKNAKDAGTESFTIKDANNAESSSSVNLTGQPLNFKTTTAYKDGAPKSFELDQEPNIKLLFAFDNGAVNVTGIKEAMGKTSPNAVILENLVWHHYYFLIQRYDQKKGGVQNFSGFVPSVMANLPVTVEARERGVSIDGIPVKLDHYVATANLTLGISIWTDTDGKLIYVTIPSQAIEAIRQEYAGNIESVRTAVAEAAKRHPSKEIDYSAPANAPFTAEEVTVQAKGHTLGGTLLLPKTGHKPFPAVITITGSGQQTRDEPIPLPGLENYKPFRQIAEALASNGIAVLRVDDRGVGKSTGLEGLKEATTFDFADDTRAQVAYLRTRPEIDPNRIGLIGHSEGGVIAPIVASTDPKIAAIALMAGTAKTGEKVSMSQAEFAIDNAGKTGEEKKELLDKQQKLLQEAMSGTNDPSLPGQLKLPWMITFLKYD